MTKKYYPELLKSDIQDVVTVLKEITRIRIEDVAEFNDLDSIFVKPVNTIDLVTVSTQFDTTSTTLANVTGLSLDVEAGRTYSFRAVLHYDADGVGGHKYAINGTATATAIKYQINSIRNSTNAYVINSRQTALGGNAGEAGATAGMTTIEGVITVNAAGTLTVQFAQNAAGGTSSILTGSSFEMVPI